MKWDFLRRTALLVCLSHCAMKVAFTSGVPLRGQASLAVAKDLPAHISLQQTWESQDAGRRELQSQELGLDQAPADQSGSTTVAAGQGQKMAADAPSSSAVNLDEDSKEAAKYELVLARLDEDVSWLSKIPAFWKVTIYNKGGASSVVAEVPGRPFTVINVANQGRESESYMHHILLRWTTLAEYTVFGQANPFIHSKYFVELLNHPRLLRRVQCMSLVYTSVGHPHNVTPKKVVETYRKHMWYRSERMSLRTLDSIYFNDVGAAQIGKQYLLMHSLPEGTNIIAHHLDVIGLPGWVPHEREIGSFAYGGHFGVHRDNILQHPRFVYENFQASMIGADLHTYVAERLFLILFGGIDFQDT